MLFKGHMDFLKSHVFTSFLISSIYFIVKSLINRLNKSEEDKDFVRRTVFKDSILLFILSYLIFVFKEQLFSIQLPKTDVFTNEPSF
jgi:hypothetical protein